MPNLASLYICSPFDYQIFLNWLRVRFGDILSNLGFKVQIFPSEWALHLKYLWESLSLGSVSRTLFLSNFVHSHPLERSWIHLGKYVEASVTVFSMFTNLFLPQQNNLNKHSIVLHSVFNRDDDWSVKAVYLQWTSSNAINITCLHCVLHIVTALLRAICDYFLVLCRELAEEDWRRERLVLEERVGVGREQASRQEDGSTRLGRGFLPHPLCRLTQPLLEANVTTLTKKYV